MESKQTPYKLLQEAIQKELSLDDVLEYLQGESERYQSDAKIYGSGAVKDLAVYRYQRLEKAIHYLKTGTCNDASSQCLQCGNDFFAKTTRAKFCSGKCRTAFNRKKNDTNQ